MHCTTTYKYVLIYAVNLDSKMRLCIKPSYAVTFAVTAVTRINFLEEIHLYAVVLR